MSVIQRTRNEIFPLNEECIAYLDTLIATLEYEIKRELFANVIEMRVEGESRQWDYPLKAKILRYELRMVEDIKAKFIKVKE